jgi:DNA-binding MarR family transcriptional regulator
VTKHSKEVPIDYCALADFRYEIRRFLNFSERAVHKAGIEPQQHQALLAIKGLAPKSNATVGVLAERLQIQHHSAVELSGRLEARGWIRRERNDEDRREVLLRLTRRGESRLRKLSIAHQAELLTAGQRLIRALQSAMKHTRRGNTGAPSEGASGDQKSRRQARKRM